MTLAVFESKPAVVVAMRGASCPARVNATYRTHLVVVCSDVGGEPAEVSVQPRVPPLPAHSLTPTGEARTCDSHHSRCTNRHVYTQVPVPPDAHDSGSGSHDGSGTAQRPARYDAVCPVGYGVNPCARCLVVHGPQGCPVQPEPVFTVHSVDGACVPAVSGVWLR